MANNALDLIRGSARLLGAVSPGESMTPGEETDCLELLNEMLESWSLDSLIVFQILQEQFTLTASVGSYTVGPAGVFNTVRPLDILSGFIRESGTDYYLQPMTRREYDRISIKTIATRPRYLFYEPSVPLATLFLYPVPEKSYTIFFNSYKQLQSFPTLTTVIVLPPGYKRLIRYNLAIEIAPEFRRTPPPEVVAIARQTREAVERQNSRIGTLRIDHVNIHGYSGGTTRAEFIAGY